MIKNENHGEITIVTFSDEFHTPNRRNDSFSKGLCPRADTYPGARCVLDESAVSYNKPAIIVSLFTIQSSLLSNFTVAFWEKVHNHPRPRNRVCLRC